MGDAAAAVTSVLVVDDNEVNRQLAVAFAEVLGWQTTEAESGARALELLTQHSFDSVLLDISMPGLSGIEVLGRMRSSPDTAGMWVIAYTAHALPEETATLLDCGFDRVLVKPITVDGLEEALQGRLGKPHRTC